MRASLPASTAQSELAEIEKAQASGHANGGHPSRNANGDSSSGAGLEMDTAEKSRDNGAGPSGDADPAEDDERTHEGS